MTTIQTPPNSVWPNGLKRDEEGYVNFYPLGTNKVDISTITWPEGTEVKSPFVYQDDKLVGFIDTKALDIDNNNTTIDINYTHFDADLDSIMENTLTINAPANATVNVKYGAVDKVLTEKIEKLIGKEKCEVKFDKNNNKVTIVVVPDTPEEQIAEIKSLINRVLASNLQTEIQWPDGLPITYTRLEYLEANNRQYIDTGIKLSGDSRVICEFSNCTSGDGMIFGARQDLGSNAFCATAFVYWPSYGNEYYRVANVTEGKLDANKNKWTLNNLVTTFKKIPFETPVSALLFAMQTPDRIDSRCFIGRISSFSISYNDQLQCNYIPALNDTGTPGMYDTVNKVFKTNAGTGDFLYPTDAAPAM